MEIWFAETLSDHRFNTIRERYKRNKAFKYFLDTYLGDEELHRILTLGGMQKNAQESEDSVTVISSKSHKNSDNTGIVIPDVETMFEGIEKIEG